MGKIVINGEQYAGKNLDLANNIVTFDSQDEENPSAYAEQPLLTSKSSLKNLFKTFSIIGKNVRYLYKLLGTTDISQIGDGTVTGAINSLNTGLENANGGANNVFTIETYQKNYTISGTNSTTPYTTVTFAVAVEGKIPIAISVKNVGHPYVYPYAWSISGTTASVAIRSTWGSDFSNLACQIAVTYVSAS